MPSPTRSARAARRVSASRTSRPHHAQARISDEAAQLLAELAIELGVSESEIVRDALYSRLFGSASGATMTGPDEGYRIAKSTASAIARKMLLRAYQDMPDTYEGFQQLIEEEGS